MDLVDEFTEASSIHGIKDFRRLKSSRARRLWTVVVVACTVIMFYEMFMVALEYQENPTGTQVTSIFLDAYPYPRILFCTNDWINETAVAELNVSKPLLVYALSLLQDLLLEKDEKENFTASGHDLTDLDATLSSILRSQNYSTYADFYRLIAYEPHLVAHCPRCDFIRKHVLASGVCIQIRLIPASSAFLIQSPPAFLYTGPPPDMAHEYLVPKYSGVYTADALYVSYLPQNEFFLHDPLLLNKDSSYVVQIKPILYKRLNKPKQPCFPPDRVDEAFTNYSQLMCYANCDEARKKKCQKCFYLGYNPTKVTLSSRESAESNVTLPTDFNMSLCTSLLHDPKSENCTSDGGEFDECTKSCIPLCHEWVYQSTLIPVSQRRLLTENKEDITVAFSYQVRYGETVIKEVPTYTWDTFLSNVGGQLGLWLGAGAMSVLQLLHFLVVLIYEQCLRRHRGRGNEVASIDEVTQNSICKNSDARMSDIRPAATTTSTVSRQSIFADDSNARASSNGACASCRF